MWRELVASSRVAGAFPYLGGLKVAAAPKPALWRRRVEPAPANHFDSKRNAESRQGKPGRKGKWERISALTLRLGTQHRADPVSLMHSPPAGEIRAPPCVAA